MDILEVIFMLLALAILIEGIISYGNSIFKDHKLHWQIVAALILGGVFCYNSD